MEKKVAISETVRRRVILTMAHIEFMGIEDRCEEVASVYRYLGLKPTLVRPMKLYDPDGKKFLKGMYTYNNMLGNIQMARATAIVNPNYIRLTLPRYDITVRDDNPAELVFFLVEKANDFKKKFDEVNRAIIANRKRINNARESVANKVEVVNDFLGTGNRNVSTYDFKAYITGLSVANHSLKKRAKNIYRRYMKMKDLQNIILQSYIGEDNFGRFYKVYCNVCKQHRKNEN